MDKSIKNFWTCFNILIHEPILTRIYFINKKQYRTCSRFYIYGISIKDMTLVIPRIHPPALLWFRRRTQEHSLRPPIVNEAALTDHKAHNRWQRSPNPTTAYFLQLFSDDHYVDADSIRYKPIFLPERYRFSLVLQKYLILNTIWNIYKWVWVCFSSGSNGYRKKYFSRK